MRDLSLDGVTGVVDNRLVVDDKINFPCFGKLTMLDGEIEFDIRFDPSHLTWLVETDMPYAKAMSYFKSFGSARSVSDTTYAVSVLSSELGDRYRSGMPWLPLPGEYFESSDAFKNIGFRIVKWKTLTE